ncbi:MAG: hypothetical protein GX615_14470, partial [Lentisphaerae bacterium]|nr:hypothetical protein [Lentisphaerota bacterium]
MDVVLAPLLSQTPPSLDALLLSFEAAVADGRLYAAERRAMAVLDGNGKPSASFLHAADVAGKLGKDGVRRDRLVYFLQVEPGATPQVRNALAELCSEGGDAAFFIRYVKAFGPDADALDLGLLCLLRQREGGRSAEYLKLADYLLGAWEKQPNALRRVIGELAAAKRANVYGITADGLTELILAHGITDERCVLDWMWSPGGWGETHSTCEALLALQEKTIPALLPLPLFRAFMNLHGVAPGDRDAFAKRVWALRQAAMQSTNTAYACAMGDQLDAGIARYLAGAAKRSPLVRQNALAALLEWSGPNDTALLA